MDALSKRCETMWDCSSVTVYLWGVRRRYSSGFVGEGPERLGTVEAAGSFE